MNFGLYGILVIFGLFILLMIVNPKLSCFGKKIASPLYPLMRKKKQQKRRIKTEDYGFDLGGKPSGPGKVGESDISQPKKNPARDYGFSLGGSDSEKKPEHRHEPAE